MKYEGIAYRAHTPKWAHLPLSGAGAANTGGRFNDVGQPALYLSLKIEVAIAEVSQGLPFTPPLTLVSYDLDFEDIADLTSDHSRSSLSVSFNEIACPWKLEIAAGRNPQSRQVARRLLAANYAGLLVPSFVKPTEINLVLFEWSNALPHRVLAKDPHGALPKNQASWT